MLLWQYLSFADQETPSLRLMEATRYIPHTYSDLFFKVPAPRPVLACSVAAQAFCPLDLPIFHENTVAYDLSVSCCRLCRPGLSPWGWSSWRGLQTLRVLSGDLGQLPAGVRDFVERSARLCQPEGIHICDGTKAENTATLALLEKQGLIRKLPKYSNW